MLRATNSKNIYLSLAGGKCLWIISKFCLYNLDSLRRIAYDLLIIFEFTHAIQYIRTLNAKGKEVQNKSQFFFYSRKREVSATATCSWTEMNVSMSLSVSILFQLRLLNINLSIPSSHVLYVYAEFSHIKVNNAFFRLETTILQLQFRNVENFCIVKLTRTFMNRFF